MTHKPAFLLLNGLKAIRWLSRNELRRSDLPRRAQRARRFLTAKQIIYGLKAQYNLGLGNARSLKVKRDEDFGGKIVAKQSIFMTKSRV
jgi:hypothetical protein